MELIVKDLETALLGVSQKLKTDLGGIRGNRPSPEAIENIRIELYGQTLTIRELGSISILPPRTIQVTVWDKEAVNPVMKAIDAAHLGLTSSSDGSTIRATVSALGNERREELMKLVKKTAEAARIQLRSRRDDIMKRVKDGEAAKELTKDDVFKGKEKIQKVMDKANAEIETAVEGKLTELGE